MHRVFATLLTLLLLSGTVFSHPADVSHLRVQVGRQQVGFRLTLNLLTLSRIVVIDGDHDQRITPQEIAKAVPLAVAYLKEKVLVNVNGTDADLGEFQRYECVWPHSDTEVVTDREASQRFVDFNFARAWPAGVQEVWTGFQIFAEAGDQHTVQALYQQEGQPDLPVDFSASEPEYLYDTGWGSGPVATAPLAAADHSEIVVGAALLALAGAVTGWFKWRRGGGIGWSNDSRSSR